MVLKILIDGDSCPKIRTIEQIACKYNISCHIYCNTCTLITSDYSQLHIVEKRRDSADFAIINNCKTDDIVVTNDSGLAAMVLSKHGKPINAKGMLYTDENIMKFLNNRYIRAYSKRKNNRDQVHGTLYTPYRGDKNSFQTMLKNMLSKHPNSEKSEVQPHGLC